MTISRSDFLQRAMKYCAESERCTHDVFIKLEAWGVSENEIDGIIQKLYTEKFIDDKRFATSYVTEKWNLDRWGKIKINYGLQQKNLDENIIDDALNTIDDEKYTEGLYALLQKKWNEVKSGNKLEDVRRVLNFALSRGFEEELIWEWLKRVDSSGMPDAGYQIPDS